MSDPIILSDGEDPETPLEIRSKKKKPRILQPDLVVVEDSTPPSTSTLPSEAPYVSDPLVLRCENMTASLGISETNPGLHKLSGISRLICLESDSESESGSRRDSWKESITDFSGYEDSQNLNSYSQLDSANHSGHVDVVHMFESSSSPVTHSQDDDNQAYDDDEKENLKTEQMNTSPQWKGKMKASLEKRVCEEKVIGKKKMTKEERARLMEEKRLKKEEEKLKKAAVKAKAGELKLLQKEKEKWEKGKFALKSIVAHIDARVVELGSVGGWLLSSFANKGIAYRIAQNPIERSVVWNMAVPEQILQLSPSAIEISYILFVFEAEEFCDAVNNEALLQLVSRVRNQHPSYTVCFLTNRLRAYIDKKEKENYKNPANNHGWKCPPIEEVLAKLATHYNRVHYRHCADEAELAEHIVGLTCSLASCQFRYDLHHRDIKHGVCSMSLEKLSNEDRDPEQTVRKKLTRLSVNANGSIIPKDSINKNLIKKSVWLKALLAIPKVQPRFALAIWKRYPTMKSLLQVYMDPCMTVHEKEFLLKDLTIEGLLGNDRRLGEVCSKRVYRILMAQSGSIKTDDVEDGADFFINQ